MKNIFLILLLSITSISNAQQIDIEDMLKKQLKFATVYGAVNGGTSVSDVETFSILNGLETSIIETPYDYSVTFGIRKIARFGYENRANTFYDGTESNYTDAATVGKVQGFEYLFEVDYSRQQGLDYIDQHHFIRYSSDDDCDGPYCINHFAAKVEYLKDGFADVEYFELSERYRWKKDKALSFSIGAAHRLAEPYGYNPLDEWILDNGNLHYTYLAIQEGYTIDVANSEYKDPSGTIVANSAEVWKEVVIPQVLADYVEKLPDDAAAKKVLMALRSTAKALKDARLKEDLAEAKAEIKSLKSDLNEAVKETNATNLLNAKLLYTNKIFKSKNLNESQKVKVLSSFDKANTVKESKLIYETLNEGLKVKKSNIKENLGRASKATTVPTTKKPIVESNDVFARMQKLAGIK